jgi:uncharacterized membrane protein YccC
MVLAERTLAILRTLHWRRGLRAGFAVASAMLVCRALGRPMGWAALGGFESVLVDNGGPYRSRLATIATVLLGGALCGTIGTLVPQVLIAGMAVTAAVCFAVTFARVASQPIASTSVVILVIYFVGFGSAEHTLHNALVNDLAFVLGGLWAGLTGLFLWPVDPFRPARLELAECYRILSAFTMGIRADRTAATVVEPELHAIDLRRQLRARMELARTALAATGARAPSRTVRARNLTVLLETADQLFVATIRLTELAEVLVGAAGPSALVDITHWLGQAELALAEALDHKPTDDAASFGREGSHRIEYIGRRAALLSVHLHALNHADESTEERPPLLDHLVAEEKDALQNVEIAFEAVHALWTGVEARPGDRIAAAATAGGSPPATADPTLLEPLRQNWTFDSVTMRHALRMAVVGAVDVLLMGLFHLSHGFWLAMTSIIVLQPYGSGTVRRSMQRVGGTIAGGVLAALLAAAIHTQGGTVAVITVFAVLTLATYPVDYAWYSFFLTPTFVLLSLPHLQDWRYAGFRMVTTVLGAATAVVAMRLLWPQSTTVELGQLFSRSAAAAAGYLRATLAFWSMPLPQRVGAERTLLAPARRNCGLTSQDAEEALDRLMLEPALGSHERADADAALKFTTYVRRFTQCITTLAAAGVPTPRNMARVRSLMARLDGLTAMLAGETSTGQAHRTGGHTDPVAGDDATATLAEQMLQRMERQAGILERAAAHIGV